MTVSQLYRRSSALRHWRFWEKIKIPKSWYMVDGGDSVDRTRDRGNIPYRESRFDRDRDLELDDTRSFRRRYDDRSDQPPATPKVQVPFGVIISVAIYLIGQLVGGVWWAATLQSNLQHEIADRAKEESRLWENIQTYRVEVNALRLEIARLHPSSRTGRQVNSTNGNGSNGEE